MQTDNEDARGEHGGVLYAHVQNENIMLFFLECDESAHTCSIKHKRATRRVLREPLTALP